MAFEIVCVLIVVCSFLTIFSTGKDIFLFGAPSTGLFIWLIVSMFFPWREPQEFLVKPVNVNGTEIVVWHHEDQTYIFNANNLGRTFGEKLVRVKYYKSGYYAGILYPSKVEYDHMEY